MEGILCAVLFEAISFLVIFTMTWQSTDTQAKAWQPVSREAGPCTRISSVAWRSPGRWASGGTSSHLHLGFRGEQDRVLEGKSWRVKQAETIRGE